MIFKKRWFRVGNVSPFSCEIQVENDAGPDPLKLLASFRGKCCLLLKEPLYESLNGEIKCLHSVVIILHT